jgi:hypothetical protein
MAGGRRGDQLGKDLSSFFKQAVSALEDASEQLVKSGQAGKASLDVQLLKRQREKALARLGEVLLDEHERGVSLPPAADDLLAEVKKLDARVKEAQAEADALWKTDGKNTPPTAPTSRVSDDDEDDDDDDE